MQQRHQPGRDVIARAAGEGGEGGEGSGDGLITVALLALWGALLGAHLQERLLVPAIM
jgi:hypothetical protein